MLIGDRMKKILISILLIVSIFALSGCGPKTYDQIDYQTLKKMVSNKEDFVLILGQTTCSACAAYKITINELVKNTGLDIKYIDIDVLDEKEHDYVMEHFYLDATPVTAFVKNGEEVREDRITGNQKYSKVEAKFKEKGYIK